MNKKYINLIIYFVCIVIILTMGRASFLNHFFNKKETIVPNVMFLSEEEAKSILSKARLDYKIIYSKSTIANENAVFLQEPAQNSVVKVNRKVNIWINKSDALEIPDITGKTLVEAKIFLDKLSIDIERIDYVPTENTNEEIVLSIYPKVGSKINLRSKISLLVSSKSLIKTNIMPNLIGLEKTEALKALAELGKTISRITETKDASFAKNVIVATSPLPGESIDENTPITIVLNTGLELDKTIDQIIKEEQEAKEKQKQEESKPLTEEDNKEIEKILQDTLKELDKKEEGE